MAPRRRSTSRVGLLVDHLRAHGAGGAGGSQPAAELPPAAEAPGPLSGEEVAHFWRRGFLVLRGCIDPDEHARLASKVHAG